MPKAKKLKKIKLTIHVELEGPKGMDEFARLLRVLHDNGYSPAVNELLKELITLAKKRGLSVPPNVEAFANAKVPSVH
jgi:hypothetical protein